MTDLRVTPSLKTALGDLDRVSAWLMVRGYVNAEPSYPHNTAVMNPSSDLAHNLYGTDCGSRSRTVTGIATIPLNLTVVISAKVKGLCH